VGIVLFILILILFLQNGNTVEHIMKTTDYFRNKVLIKRPYLKMAWIEKVMNNPLKTEFEENGERIRFWGYIEEIDKYIRVITLSDGKTVHNAFPDRGFKIVEEQ
jgi:hypothetical protein